jgi:hypothetical protein
MKPLLHVVYMDCKIENVVFLHEDFHIERSKVEMLLARIYVLAGIFGESRISTSIKTLVFAYCFLPAMALSPTPRIFLSEGDSKDTRCSIAWSRNGFGLDTNYPDVLLSSARQCL